MSGIQQISAGKLFFEDGLPGFPGAQFFHISKEDPAVPFFQMISIEDETIGFWLADPFIFVPDYQFDLPEYAKAALRLEEEVASIAVLNMITFREKGQATLNLKAPIVVNCDNRMAKQVILNEERYALRHPLFT